MNFKRLYPKTKTVEADVLFADGYVNLGCKLKDGKIFPTKNAEERPEEVPQNIYFARYSPLNKNYAICADDYFYMSADGLNYNFRKKFSAISPSLVEVTGNTSCGSFIVGEEKFFFFTDANGVAQPIQAGIRSAVLKNGRFIGVDVTNPYKIKWSGETSYSDWTESISGAGWAVVGYGYGKILNLVLYKDIVVAVREYGLTLFDAHGTPENFKLKYIEGATPKIYPDTAFVSGGVLVFYTEDGFYGYDGSAVKKIEFTLSSDISAPVCAAVFEKGYIICGNSKTLNKKAILVADVKEKDAYLIDAEADVITCGDKIYSYLNGKVYELKEGLPYTFISGEINFSSTRKKVLKEIVLDAEAEIEIEVSNGVNSRILRGINGKIRVNLRGEKFKITLKSSNKIKSVKAVAEVINEV